MEAQVKSCQNCKKNFTVETEDFLYYEKIKVPAPTWCPECRMIRRLSFINTWSLFWRNCDKCGVRTLSEYPIKDKVEVFCQKCWWADDWDGTEYAMNYDASQPFLEQLKELIDNTPHVAQESQYTSLKNSEYSNSIAWSKNCYLVFWADYCENVFHSSLLNGAKETADSIRVYKSELCYQTIGQNDSYRVFFSQECDACSDVWFSRNCYSSMYCIGCVNLRGASYQIFNVQYSKEEYFEKLKEFRLNTRSGIKKLQKEAEGFWKKHPYRFYTGHSLNLNVTGEYLFNSKNSKDIYIASKAENSKWCQFITVSPIKDCMDYSGWGNGAELIYESGSVGENVSNIKFSSLCFPDSINLEYCIWNISGKNNFGCVNLKRKSCCILNKQYSKEEYEVMKGKIVEDMKTKPYIDKLGRKFFYGEFFPLEFSKFAYNNSNAYKFFPKTKEEIQKEGFTWNDEVENQVEATMKGEDLPETIVEISDDIFKEVISCTACERKYKIASLELDLLRKMNIPLPDRCLKFRENSLFVKLQMPKLYDRKCDKCSAEIRTSYAPDREELIYCAKCYQQEFI